MCGDMEAKCASMRTESMVPATGFLVTIRRGRPSAMQAGQVSGRVGEEQDRVPAHEIGRRDLAVSRGSPVIPVIHTNHGSGHATLRAPEHNITQTASRARQFRASNPRRFGRSPPAHQGSSRLSSPRTGRTDDGQPCCCGPVDDSATHHDLTQINKRHSRVRELAVLNSPRVEGTRFGRVSNTTDRGQSGARRGEEVGSNHCGYDRCKCDDSRGLAAPSDDTCSDDLRGYERNVSSAVGTLRKAFSSIDAQVERAIA